jgi:2,3-bisphosphoglycerate-independent phosphoglycerate mutase
MHVFTDGRDTPPRAAPDYLRVLRDDLAGLSGVRIATVTGRYFAMDRDNRWDRVAQAYDVMVNAEGAHAPDAIAAVTAAHARDVTDEFVPATALADYAGMRDGDGLLCFNFRADRVREILAALLDPGFMGFARKRVVRFAAAAGMTEYSSALNPFLGTLFAQQSLADGLGEVVSRAGMTQLRMAETEKYPHVTYFLNGGEERPYPGEDRIMVPSPKVATYDLQPEMSAPELTDKAVAAIDSGKYDLIVLNFANPDMVGHTGVLAAAIRAVETVDASLGRIVDAVTRQGGTLLVTADHGNCELMKDPVTGGPHTAHTTNAVPVLLVNPPVAGTRIHEGKLADVAPTLLALLGLPQPAAMTGRSLID